ncbi:MAG: PqqD family protein [Lachnospiraceae bacterium]|nr:PqqD family protein [Lachnospiraceae bacterium]
MAVPVGSRTAELNGIIALNETAAFLWGFFQEEHTEEEAVQALLREFDVDEETAGRSVKRLVEQMAAEGLLEE